MIGVPSQLLALLFLSLALRRRPTWAAVPLLTIALVVWASLAIMVPLLVQQRFFGIPNRVFMVAYGVWLILAARPLAKTGSAPSDKLLIPLQSAIYGASISFSNASSRALRGNRSRSIERRCPQTPAADPMAHRKIPPTIQTHSSLKGSLLILSLIHI